MKNENIASRARTAIIVLGMHRSGTSATAGAGAGAATIATGAACCITTGAATPMLLTMRTLPSASVISNSETLESDTKSISVLSLRKSINPPML